MLVVVVVVVAVVVAIVVLAAAAVVQCFFKTTYLARKMSQIEGGVKIHVKESLC